MSARDDAEALLARARVTRAAPAAVPACDPGMFYGLIGEIATAAQDGSEADPAGVHACLLALSGALAGTSPHVRIGNSRHPMLIWPLLIGRTNSGRKGEATATALRIGHAASHELAGIYATGLSSGEGLIERIRDSNGPEDTGGTEDKRLLVVEPEMGRVMAVSGREGTTLPAIMRSAWEGQALAAMTKKAVTACESHISVIGNITPAEFRAKVRASDMSGGTWNRYLPIYVERRRLIADPQGFSPEEIDFYGGKLRDAIRAARERSSISLSPDAHELWVESIYPEFAEFDEDTPAAEFVQRAAPYVRRIAALYAALDGRWLVSVADLTAAAVLVRYSIASAEFTFDGSPRDAQLDKLRRAVDEAGAAGLSDSEISAVFNRHLRADARKSLVDRLTSDGLYAYVKIETGGRPSGNLFSAEARKKRKSAISPLTSQDGADFSRAAAQDAQDAETPADEFLRTVRDKAQEPEPLTSDDRLPALNSLSAQSRNTEPAPAVARVPARCRMCKRAPTMKVGPDWLCADHAKAMTPKSLAGIPVAAR